MAVVSFPDAPAPPARVPLLADPRMHEAILLLGALVLLFTRLGETTLSSYDDAYYAEKAKEIVATGEWLVPPWGYAPSFDNTPLYLWGTALLFQLFGVSEFAARALSAAAGVGCVLLTYRFGRRLYGPWPGFLAGAVLLTTPHFLKYARHAMLDTTQTLLVGACVYLLVLGTERARTLPMDLGAGVLMGLAVLNKSLLGYLAPAIYVAYVLAARVPRERAYRPGFWGAVGTGVLLPAVWFVAVTLRHGREFLDVHFGYILWERAVRGDPGQEVGWTSYFSYLGGLAVNFLPWIPLAAWGAWTLLRGQESRRRALLPVCWAGTVVILLSLPAAKKSWYVMPAYPALALLAGYGLDLLLARREHCRVRFTAGLAAGLTAFGLAANLLPIPLAKDRNRDVAALADEIRRVVPPGEHLLCFNLEPHWRYVSGTYFYADRPLALPENNLEVMLRILRQREGPAVLTDDATWRMIEDRLEPPPRLLGSSGDLRLLGPPDPPGDPVQRSEPSGPGR